MNNKELIQIANAKLTQVTKRPDIVMNKGKGMYIYDVEGKKYLDFIAGWAVNSLGHSPKAVANALKKQSKILINGSPSFYNLPMIEFADLLLKGTSFDRAFFCSIGAEANEGAIKAARKYGSMFKKGAFEIITTSESFHGRTLTTMAASGKTAFEKLFEPKTKGFLKSKFNDIKSVKKLVTRKTCAIMLELIQGEAGVFAADKEYIAELRKLCDKENLLLILDEVQTGMGRTGKMFCHEHYGIAPDIMTLAKGIGAGFPLAAVLTKEKLNIFEPGEQGGTYTAQPLAMAVGKAVLRELKEGGVIKNCEKMGKLITARLQELSGKYEIENVRGMGLLIGFDLKKTDGGVFAGKCMEDGLLINSPKPKIIRLMPALTVTEKEIDELFTIMKKHLAVN